MRLHITLKGSSSSGWYAPPRGTHSGDKHRAVGSGKAVGSGEIGASAALSKLLSQRNMDDLKVDARGLAWARDVYGNRIDTYGYNPRTRHLFATASTHAIGVKRYLPDEDFDDFVKIIREDDVSVLVGGESFKSVPQIRIYIDRHNSRNETDAWNKAFDAAKVLQRVGFSADTRVKLSTYMSDSKVQELELGAL